MSLLVPTMRRLALAAGATLAVALAGPPALAAPGGGGPEPGADGLDTAAPAFPRTFAALRVHRRCTTLPDISGNGRYVAFDSRDAYTAQDDNTLCDVYVWDLVEETLTLVSVGLDGTAGNGGSQRPTISDDGRTVAFESSAADLVAGDANRKVDVFVRHRREDVTTKVSTPPAGGDADGASWAADLAPSGTSVAFQTDAVNLVSPDINGATDVLVADLATGALVRASVNNTGRQLDLASSDPTLSQSGRRVSFLTAATNLGGGSVRRAVVRDLDRLTSRPFPASGQCVLDDGTVRPAEVEDAVLSANGDRLAITVERTPDCRFGTPVVVRAHQPAKVLIPTTGVTWTAPNLALSQDGRTVAWRDMGDGEFDSVRSAGTYASEDWGGCHADGAPALSATGRFVAVHSLYDCDASRLVWWDRGPEPTIPAATPAVATAAG